MFLSSWSKKKAIKKFVYNLPADLSSRYGYKESYSAGQIEKTLTDCQYGKKYHGYAYIMYLDHEDAISKIGEEAIAKAIRTEIADMFFDGDKSFSPKMFFRSAVGNSGNDSISGGAGGGD